MLLLRQQSEFGRKVKSNFKCSLNFPFNIHGQKNIFPIMGNNIVQRSFTNLKILYANRIIESKKAAIILCDGLILSIKTL